jgi:hypothetical protein
MRAELDMKSTEVDKSNGQSHEVVCQSVVVFRLKTRI